MIELVKQDRILVFHLYVYRDENYFNNVAYRFHLECLKRYSHLFTKACFNISTDNINDSETINKVKHDLIDCNFNNIEIIVTENNYYCEVNTFKYFILDRIEQLNGLIFFGHTKGIINVIDGINYPDNILNWVYSMYFFNLEDEYYRDMERRLIHSYGGPQNTFYGTLRAIIYDYNVSFFPGTFYWINIKKLREDNLKGEIRIPEICNRNFCEELPYIYKKENNPYNGVASFCNKDVKNIWLYNNNNWNDISSFLSNGNNEKYLETYNIIRRSINNE